MEKSFASAFSVFKDEGLGKQRLTQVGIFAGSGRQVHPPWAVAYLCFVESAQSLQEVAEIGPHTVQILQRANKVSVDIYLETQAWQQSHPLSVH